ncbi:MFS general substrate transporter [Nadsonia fulvescens var. elongata DSM 6958]|uniref:MFS general substrate transporter n=1 Tax=Nadsonia fulvescens var. elongata DSM 6958 TaxID=857566 RepID=A0A1E3PQV5_9ASCO|nr:MFS general substrate transporter [Nadsonia fulvescens var. elongata DSM 6958]
MWTSVNEKAVPGTVHLIDISENLQVAHSESKKDVVLVPAPSDDPEDPLNWTTARKYRAMALCHLYTFVIGWSSASVYSILVPVSEATGLSVADLNRGSGTMLLFFGWGCVFWQPFGLTFGRRGCYLISLALSAAISVWTAYSTNYSTWVTQRILLGLFGAPIEGICEVTVTDLFFSHQRGRHIGTYVLMLTAGAYLSPLANGFINQSMGWQWVMYWAAIINGAAFVVCFFFMEETMYYRNTTFEASVDQRNDSQADLDIERESAVNSEEMTEKTESPSSVKEMEIKNYPKKTYLQKLKLFTYIPEKPNEFWTMMYRPFLVSVRLPIVIWASFIHGIAVCCFTSTNATASVILSAAPYNFKSSMVGLTYIAPTIGAVLGGFWSGEISDIFCLWMARRNGGYKESEHRLWSMVLICIIPPAGLILWGVGAAHGIHWVGLTFGMGMLGFTLSGTGGVVFGYVIDSYKEVAGETLIIVNIIRCTMAFGYGYAVTPWVENEGLQNSFIEMAAICVVCFSTFIIFIKFGKSLRRRSAKYYWKMVRSGLKTTH